MSLSDSAESNFLKLWFQNTDWANIGDAGGLRGSVTAGSLYSGLHTSSPGETGSQTTNETAFTNYTRVGTARSAGGWATSGTSPTQVSNVGAVTFPACGASGSTVTDFHVGRASSAAGEIGWYGALTSSLAISNGITASFAAGQLVCTLD